MTWPPERSRDGGVDRLPLPEGVAGSLWLCGKHWIGPDWERAQRELDADVVVCLCHGHEMAERYPSYVSWLQSPSGPLAAHWVPVHDLHAPAPEQAVEMADTVVGHLQAGRTVVIHCGAGIGRAGTVAAAVLMRLGRSRLEAVAEVAAARPLAGPEVGAQSDLLAHLEGLDGFGADERG